jgi:hypothetical protein
MVERWNAARLVTVASTRMELLTSGSCEKRLFLDVLRAAVTGFLYWIWFVMIDNRKPDSNGQPSITFLKLSSHMLPFKFHCAVRRETSMAYPE